MNRTVTKVLTLGASLVVLAGCSAPAAPVEEVETPVATASTDATESATPTEPAVEEAPVPEDVETSGKDGKLPVTGVAVDSLGEYNRTTVDEYDAAMVWVEKAVDPSALENYTKEEVLSFQKEMVKFVAEEVIDSPVNVPNGDQAKTLEEFEKWWADNKDRIEPTQAQSIYDSVVNDPTKTTFLVMSQWRNENNASQVGTTYTAIRNDDNTRVTDRKLTVEGITGGEEAGHKFLSIDVGIRYVSPIDNGETNAVEDVSGTLRYSAVLEGDKWLIGGYSGQTTATIRPDNGALL